VLDDRRLGQAGLGGEHVRLGGVWAEGIHDGLPILPDRDHDRQLGGSLRAPADVNRQQARVFLDPWEAAFTNERVELGSTTFRDPNAQDPDDHAIWYAPLRNGIVVAWRWEVKQTPLACLDWSGVL
jgi:hypothetical protein